MRSTVQSSFLKVSSRILTDSYTRLYYCKLMHACYSVHQHLISSCGYSEKESHVSFDFLHSGTVSNFYMYAWWQEDDGLGDL